MLSSTFVTYDRRERGHGKARVGWIEALKLSKIREVLMITAPEQERLGRSPLGQNHFMGVEHDLEIFYLLLLCRETQAQSKSR